VHLSGESDTLDRRCAGAVIFHGPAYCVAAGPPPVPRVLFRPTELRRLKCLVVGGSRREHSSALIDNQSAGTAGADINAEEGNGFSWVGSAMLRIVGKLLGEPQRS
jgi:hypothetical protein